MLQSSNCCLIYVMIAMQCIRSIQTYWEPTGLQGVLPLVAKGSRFALPPNFVAFECRIHVADSYVNMKTLEQVSWE